MPGNPIDGREICELEAAAVLPPLPSHVVAGALVVARGRRWRVDACVDRDDCRELHLRATGGGDRRVLLWPFDRPAAAGGTPRPRVLPLARWTERAAHTLGCAADPLAPRASFKGDVLPYQLAPAIAMAGGASRVLLADEVGLGKTIQAGWILGDLLAREPDARALVAVPAGLRDQWASELAAFFSLAPARVDAAWLRAVAADRPADVSPWAAPGVYLGSIDFLKRPDVAQSCTVPIWDLLVVDEAHGTVAPTERHAALAAIAARARRVVIITATPYSGDAAGFSSMTSLGATAGEPPPLMFRRSREDAGDRRARRHRFAMVRIGRAEYRLQRLLERYSRDVWRDAPAGADGARLAMTILRKRALSSPAAALRSLTRRFELLRGAIAPPQQLSLFEEAPEPDEALPDGALATPGLADANREQRWLETLIDAASRAAASDSKQRHLLRLLARLGGEAAIVFTEYRDTLWQLAAALPEARHLHGGLTNVERTDVQRRFNENGGILLATDAAADGLNLQQRCRLIVNYELPWNPARLEQRIGRVDRIGQRRRVHAITLVARDTAEDLVVAKLARRLARVAVTLGDRDRLAALLTDARTARAVIAGAPVEVEDASPAAPPLVRAATADFPVDRVGMQLARAAQRRTPPSGTAIARLRASRMAAPGCIAIVRVSAVNDRGVVAERPFVFHVAAQDMPKPSTHRDARALARMPTAIVETAARADPSVRRWRDEVQAVHETSVRLRIAREESLRGGSSRALAVQPGLFDGRALRQAARLADGEELLRREHERHIRALDDGRVLGLECAVDALLIVWR
jgi:superfamily II DNA or RNA helicase